MAIYENQYVSITTYTKDGSEKSCPVWIVGLENKELGFTTDSTSWKVRRISHTPRVELRPCDSRGNVVEGTEVVSGFARLVSGHEFQTVHDAVKAKYGFQFSLIVFLGGIKNFFRKVSSSSCGVIITVD